MEENNLIECSYRACNNTYKFRSNKKFCCRNCKQKAKELRPGTFRDNRILKKLIKKKPYIVFKKDNCEYCGFIPIHSCQLDVDHIDGNSKNNNPDNLQTLCANCHRLKTRINKDWENRD